MERKIPLPPARMIRPTVLIYWNALKGRVDEYSRAMKTLSRNNACEKPILSVIKRLICEHINNSGVLNRISLPRANNRLVSNIGEVPAHMREYVKTRHRVTICETFGQFVRGLAKEWNEFCEESLGRDDTRANNHFAAEGIPTAQGFSFIIPSFKKNAESRFNAAHYRSKRADQGLNHTVVRVGKKSYCVLCDWSFNWRYKGKLHQKKGGDGWATWCNVCRQAICISCRDP